MLHLFRATVDRQCDNIACEMKGKPAGRHTDFCKACQCALIPIRKLDKKRVVIASAIAVVLMTSLIISTRLFLQHRAAQREEQRVAQATARFQNALHGASASEADAIARAVQGDLHLTDEQRQRVIEASRALIANLPRALTADVQNRLEMRVRDLYRDGRISSDEQIALDQFAQEQRLAPQAVKAFVKDKVIGRLDDSYRSAAQGKSLAELGKYDEARAAYRRATEIDPGNALAWAGLGAANVLLGQDIEARPCYDKALSLDPENWLAHYNLGVLAAREGDRESAFQHLERALTVLPAAARQERGKVIDGLLHEPALEELRHDPRLADLLTGAGGQGAQP